MLSLWSAFRSPEAFGVDLSKNLRKQIQCFISACDHIEEPSVHDQQRSDCVSASRRNTAEGKFTISFLSQAEGPHLTGISILQ